MFHNVIRTIETHTCRGILYFDMAYLFVFVTVLVTAGASNFSTSLWTQNQAHSLNQFFGKLGQDVAKIQARTSLFEEVQEQIESQTKKLSKLISVLMTENKRYKETGDVINKTITRLLIENETLKSRIITLENNQNSSNTSRFCSFYCTLTAGGIHYNDKEIIRFDNIDDNTGHCYNGGNGVFTSAYSGLNFFSWTVQSHENTPLQSELVKNGRIVASSVLSVSSSTSCVVSMDIGDRVWVRINGMGNLKGNKQSSFTGFTINR
ncbi:unnamed protein product [Mytilus coruscus]|uniref:C1q domain-containing protein n=1 Tax=Mytilus coruscus TaxID=42192 RepID=A0A6J8A2C7_MYTCO|nr:unnamed protein product [Mytilus coruscus]